MSLWLILGTSFGGGMLIAAQPAINAALTIRPESPFAVAIVSSMVSALLVLLFAIVEGSRVRLPDLGSSASWTWFEGAADAALPAPSNAQAKNLPNRWPFFLAASSLSHQR